MRWDELRSTQSKQNLRNILFYQSKSVRLIKKSNKNKTYKLMCLDPIQLNLIYHKKNKKL